MDSLLWVAPPLMGVSPVFLLSISWLHGSLQHQQIVGLFSLVPWFDFFFFLINLKQARVIWEDGMPTEEISPLACRQVCGAFSQLMIDVAGPSVASSGQLVLVV